MVYKGGYFTKNTAPHSQERYVSIVCRTSPNDVVSRRCCFAWGSGMVEFSLKYQDEIPWATSQAFARFVWLICCFFLPAKPRKLEELRLITLKLLLRIVIEKQLRDQSTKEGLEKTLITLIQPPCKLLVVFSWIPQGIKGFASIRYWTGEKRTGCQLLKSSCVALGRYHRISMHCAMVKLSLNYEAQTNRMGYSG